VSFHGFDCSTFRFVFWSVQVAVELVHPRHCGFDCFGARGSSITSYEMFTILLILALAIKWYTRTVQHHHETKFSFCGTFDMGLSWSKKSWPFRWMIIIFFPTGCGYNWWYPGIPNFQTNPYMILRYKIFRSVGCIVSLTCGMSMDVSFWNVHRKSGSMYWKKTITWSFIKLFFMINWVWINTYRYIFSGMNIHLPAILMFTRGTRFWHTANWEGIIQNLKRPECLKITMVKLRGSPIIMNW